MEYLKSDKAVADETTRQAAKKGKKKHRNPKN